MRESRKKRSLSTQKEISKSDFRREGVWSNRSVSISSQLHQQIEGSDELVEEGDSDFQESGLKETSVVRISRLAIVEGQILEGRIGKISSDRLKRIRRRLAEWIRGSKRN
jgi:mRNA interferase MazF